MCSFCLRELEGTSNSVSIRFQFRFNSVELRFFGFPCGLGKLVTLQGWQCLAFACDREKERKLELCKWQKRWQRVAHSLQREGQQACCVIRVFDQAQVTVITVITVSTAVTVMTVSTVSTVITVITVTWL